MQRLNDEQRRAVEIRNKPVLVLAGAGSGKTRALTHRVVALLDEGVAPYSIMAVTFTNKAANEMKERIKQMTSVPVSDLMMGTFHSLCVRLMRALKVGRHGNFTNEPFVIVDEIDKNRIIKDILRDFPFVTIRPEAIGEWISKMKADLLQPDDVAELDSAQKEWLKLYRAYEARMDQANGIDFDDMLMHMVLTLEKHPKIFQQLQNRFTHILVDEYQDVNYAQYVLIRHLSGAGQGLFCVGDAAQAIYSWRGANIECIQAFRRDYSDCEVVPMTQNYRSTQLILDAAHHVISLEGNHYRLEGHNGAGTKIKWLVSKDEADEAYYLAQLCSKLREKGYKYSDIAILYRMNRQSRVLEEAFVHLHLPYKIVGGLGFYNRKEIRDMLAYLRLAHSPRDMIAFNRVVNVPARGIGEKSQLAINATCFEHQANAYDLYKSHGIEVFGLKGKAQKGFEQLLNSVELSYQIAQEARPVEVMLAAYRFSGYEAQFEGKVNRETEDRLQNIDELFDALERYEGTLEDFIFETSLLSRIEDVNGEEADAVVMMTSHSAKGLEFPVVIVAGVNDGIYPHIAAKSVEEQAEEIRVFYVTMTRAAEQLYLSSTEYCSRGQDIILQRPSSFLDAIPNDMLVKIVVNGTGASLRKNAAFWIHQ